MGRARKNPIVPGAKCKPQAFSRRWMGDFLEKASACLDVRRALDECKVSLVDYRRARHADPLFDAACAVLDTTVRAGIITTLESEAARGNVAAARLVAKGLDALRAQVERDHGFEAEREPDHPPHVLDAMRLAMQRAYATGPDRQLLAPIHPFAYHCPDCNKTMRPMIAVRAPGDRLRWVNVPPDQEVRPFDYDD